MFAQHIRQANEGADFDFLTSAFGKAAGEPAIY
jgi:dihydroxy-acid dehydratase